MSEVEAVIGFDLRSTAPDPDWTTDRKTGFLLRPEVAAVRSVDSHVWVRPPGLPVPPDRELLWPDLSSLLAAAHALDQAGVAVVRITAFEEEGQTPDSADPDEPPSERYVLLGYDVADWGLIGGLSNCGYKPEEAAALAPAWAPRLNRWHLFDRAEDATAFADVTAERVPEHAPFYAYGIYQLG